MPATPVQQLDYEICILAGGLSSRMGRDKASLRLGGRTMLGQIRHTVLKLNRRVRVIRRDQAPRCGPLGGIYGGLKTSRAEAVMFLACDMPFVTARLLREMVKRARPDDEAVFVRQDGRHGFPVLVRKMTLPKVALQIARKELSLQTFAKRIRTQSLRPLRGWSRQLSNVNTLADLEAARRKWRRRLAR